MSKRRSIRNKMKSLKINYMQGCKLLLFGVWKVHENRAKPYGFALTEKSFIKIALLFNNQFLCVG